MMSEVIGYSEDKESSYYKNGIEIIQSPWEKVLAGKRLC